MRHPAFMVLMVAALLGSAAAAAAQTPRRLMPALIDTPLPDLIFVRAPVDEKALISRLLSFDSNGDGRVAGDELPERMQGLMGRADSDRDGFLSVPEIDRAIDRSPSARRHRSAEHLDRRLGGRRK